MRNIYFVKKSVKLFVFFLLYDHIALCGFILVNFILHSFLNANVNLQALKSLFTSRSTGLSCKGRWLTTEDLEAYLYALSQPGALTGALNYFRNVFRYFKILPYLYSLSVVSDRWKTNSCKNKGMLPPSVLTKR